MAEYSKQWCDKNDPSITPDFDILEISNRLDPEFGITVSCEGFGFVVIGKDATGNVILGFIPESKNVNDEIVWKSYDEVVNG